MEIDKKGCWWVSPRGHKLGVIVKLELFDTHECLGTRDEEGIGVRHLFWIRDIKPEDQDFLSLEERKLKLGSFIACNFDLKTYVDRIPDWATNILEVIASPEDPDSKGKIIL